MIITPEIFAAIISAELPLENVEYLASSAEIRSIRITGKENCENENSVLFLHCLSGEENPTEPLSSYYYRLFIPDIFSCSFQDKRPVLEIYEYLTDAFTRCFTWENELFTRSMKRQSAAELCRCFVKVFPHTFALIDSDMNILYATSGYVRYISGRDPSATDIPWGALPDAQVQYMMLREDFHLVASKKEPFYYYEDFNDVNCFCRNIFIDGKYYARLVCHLDKDTEALLPGEEQLFEIFCCNLEDYFQNGLARISRHQNDPLHNLFRAMISDGNAGTADQESVLARYNWASSHTYIVIKLHFFSEDRWNAQLETTLPYLVRQLEHTWNHSCALSQGQEILWIVNLNLSEADTDSHSFYQQLAFFVRDNVCIAGVSSRFQDISLFPSAVHQADAALTIGKRNNPSFWYYLFDDYRLDYMLDKIREEIDPRLLCHPALLTLREHDREKGTSLSETLEAYLLSGLNATLAAQRIYIHRTTFCRRMDQIRNLTGIDPDDPDTILQMLLSYRLE